MKLITFTGEFITLGQFLKKVDLIGSGSDAKLFLTQHIVYVNGAEENRRGKKLRHLDQIRIGRNTWKLINEH